MRSRLSMLLLIFSAFQIISATGHTQNRWQSIQERGEFVWGADKEGGGPYVIEDEEDPEAEKEMGLLIAAVTKLRNIRAESGIDPGRKVEVLFRTDLARPRRILEEQALLVRTLARISHFRFVDEIPGDLPAARGVVTGLEMAVPLAGALDLDEERQRLSREMEKVERELEITGRKLENPSFVDRAPSEVVEKVRASHRELLARKETLSETLSSLRPPPPSSSSR